LFALSACHSGARRRREPGIHIFYCGTMDSGQPLTRLPE
jgi:hypothetical protein